MFWKKYSCGITFRNSVYNDDDDDDFDDVDSTNVDDDHDDINSYDDDANDDDDGDDDDKGDVDDVDIDYDDEHYAFACCVFVVGNNANNMNSLSATRTQCRHGKEVEASLQ